jgi:transketolase
MNDATDELCINTIRTLSMDAVQKANSGHPGTPMGLAPFAYSVWQDAMRYDPAKPAWPNRDRFILSVGHASMLLYSILHLTKVAALDHHEKPVGRESVSMDDIKSFRQLGSRCPGHPESHLTTGVECTTGPLGQGCGMSVGFAIAERWLAARYNQPGHTLIDYDTYVLCGDGDMMEGISSEAASLAGHLKLSNLCWIYDSNQISIEGATSLAFDEDTGARFLAYGWNVLHVRDANDLAAIKAALDGFKAEQSRPTLIIVESVIGYGAPHKAGTRHAHGEPLGVDEIKGAKAAYGWPQDAQFLVPDGVYEHFANGVGKRGAELSAAWEAEFAAYREAYPALAKEFETMQRRELPEGWEAALVPFPADPKGVGTRVSAGKVLNQLAAKVPYLLGGSADLAPSTMTNLNGDGSFSASNPSGRNFHFGVREHAMGAICNGMELSKLRAFGSGFFIFSDYMRAAVRMSAIQEIATVWVFTHDSIGVGEDGPTHQPVEHLASFRAMPGITTIRPADANEALEAWRVAITSSHRPTILVLSRQAMATLDRTVYAPASGTARGAYVLADPAKGAKPQLILIGTGSEIGLCLAAYEALSTEGIAVRVVSMPSWDLFEAQDASYRESVLPDSVTARVAVEMASVIGWERYVGRHGAIVGMHSFGASAPIGALQKHFGFTAEAVLNAARSQLTAHG